MRRLSLVAVVIILWGCADPDATARLSANIKTIEQKIMDARSELQRYGDGSVLYAIVSLRLSMHEQTLAMLNQKWAALRWYPRFSYTVDGKMYEPPADSKQKLEALRKALERAEKQAFEARLNALRSGGLIGTIATMTAELRNLPVAQLEYQIMALDHGFPPFAAQIKLPDDARAVEK